MTLPQGSAPPSGRICEQWLDMTLFTDLAEDVLAIVDRECEPNGDEDARRRVEGTLHDAPDDQPLTLEWHGPTHVHGCVVTCGQLRRMVAGQSNARPNEPHGRATYVVKEWPKQGARFGVFRNHETAPLQTFADETNAHLYVSGAQDAAIWAQGAEIWAGLRGGEAPL